MKRKFTFLTAALALLAFLALPMGMRGQTTVASFVRNGNSNTITGGEFTTTFSAKSGYYQDANGDCYMQILNTDAYWTTTPTSISFAAKLGGGTGNHDLSNPVYVSLLDANGDVIDETETEVTSHITTNTGDDYTISIPVANDAYGVRLSHEKESGYNVRYYSFSLSYVGDGGTPTTYTVTYDCNGGSACPENETGIAPGTTINLADGPVKENYDFAGWSDGNTTYDEGYEYTVNSNVTFTAQWTEQSSGDVHWVLTNLADLTENDVFVIVGNGYAMTNDNGTGSAPATSAVTIENNEITSTVAANIQWTVSGNAADGYTFYPNGSTTTWLYCNTEAATSSNNNMRVGTGNRKVFELNSSNYLMTKDNYVVRYLSIYNNQDWRGYINTNLSPAMSFYKKVTGGVLPPSISAENVDITYDATSGSIAYTINNGVDGGTVGAATESDWLTLGQGTASPISFTCTANEAGTARTATVTLTYTYNREAVTKDVTVTQAGDPNAVMTIAQVRTQGTGDVATKGVVTSITGSTNKTAYIQDATAAIVVYGSFTAAVGDEIRVSGTLQDYNGLLEITSPTVTVISTGNTTNPELMTIAEVVASTNQGWYIRIENATVTAINGSGNSQNTTIAQGQNTIVVRGNLGADVAVNDVISGLNGNIGYYNGNQIANPQNVTVQENLEASVTVTPNTINAPAEGADGSLALTYENITDFISFDYYFCDANGGELQEDPDWIYAEINEENDVYTLDYLIDANDGAARTAYIKVWTYDDEEEEVYAIVTVNQAEYVAPTYAELPFAFNGGKADIENTDGLYQEGLGDDYNANNNPTTKLKFDSTGDWLLLQFDERPGTLTFDIKGNGFSGGTFTVQTSEDGTTYTDLQAYTELGDTQNEEFTNLGENVRYIKWIYTNKSSGNVGLGNITLAEYTEPIIVPSITVNPATVSVNAEEHDGTLGLTYEYLTITDMSDFDIQYYDAEGEEAEVPDWIEILVAEQDPTVGEGYVVSYYMMENEGEARTAYFKVYALDDEAELVYSNLVTVTQAAPETPFEGTTYTLATTIESGRRYIITDGIDRAMGGQNNNNRAAVEITIENGVAQVENENVVELVINGPDADGFYTIYDANFPGYLYAAGGNSSNHLKTETYCDNRGQWTVTFDAETNAASIVANFDGRNTMRYNSNNDIFSCYGSGQQPVYLYLKDEDEPEYTFYKDIQGYGNFAGGYYLIASPVTVDPAEVEGMTTEQFDLYYFDESQENAEWRNYKQTNFNLVPGKGYLYAHDTDVTLTFTGVPYSGDGTITLTKTDDVNFSGWNLIGNPFGVAATIDREEFYVIHDTETGSELILSESDEIAPMQGIFVIAAEDGEEVTFTEVDNGTAPGPDVQKIVVNVRSNRGNVIDRAMIRFGEGRQLPKFMLNPNNTKLYIAQDGEDFAVVRSINENSTPFSFRAAENGTYTLSVNAENVEMEYLHLIDNMTGADVDLLATPSYSFAARTTDIADRFRLVYATYDDVNENNVKPFAFFNGSEWVINNEGNATLQVVDVMGRMISSETINGNADVNMNATPGVYMLRLVNGDNVKVQKVVVK